MVAARVELLLEKVVARLVLQEDTTFSMMIELLILFLEMLLEKLVVV